MQESRKRRRASTLDGGNHDTQDFSAVPYDTSIVQTPLLSQSPTLLSLLRNPVISDALGIQMPIDAILNLSYCCRALSGFYKGLIPSQWNITKFLFRYFDYPNSFRKMMARNHVLIAGESAFEFFERSSWKTSELQLYLVSERFNNERKEKYIIDYLEGEGYYCERVSDETDYYIDYICSRKTASASIIRLKRIGGLCDLLEDGRAANVSALGNLITWDRAYCMFPYSTFVGRKSYSLSEIPFNEMLRQNQVMLATRGFRSRDIPWDEEPRERSEFSTIRKLGDIMTWRISLPWLDVRPLVSTRVFDCQSLRWEIDTVARHIRIMDHPKISSSILQARYSFAEMDPVQHLGFSLWIRKRLAYQTQIELYKIPDEMKTEWFDRSVTNERMCDFYENHLMKNIRNVNLGPTWTYYDEDLPNWVKEWTRWHALTPQSQWGHPYTESNS